MHENLFFFFFVARSTLTRARVCVVCACAFGMCARMDVNTNRIVSACRSYVVAFCFDLERTHARRVRTHSQNKRQVRLLQKDKEGLAAQMAELHSQVKYACVCVRVCVLCVCACVCRFCFVTARGTKKFGNVSHMTMHKNQNLFVACPRSLSRGQAFDVVVLSSSPALFSHTYFLFFFFFHANPSFLPQMSAQSVRFESELKTEKDQINQVRLAHQQGTCSHLRAGERRECPCGRFVEPLCQTDPCIRKNTFL